MPLWISLRRLVLGENLEATDLFNDALQLERFRENADSELGRRPEFRLEYLKQLIDVVKEDVKHVFLNVSLDLAAVALLLSQNDMRPTVSDAPSQRVTYLISVALFFASAGFFFSYIRALHVLHMRLVRNIIGLDIYRARELFAGERGIWRCHGWKYFVGRALMVPGVMLLGYGLYLKLLL